LLLEILLGQLESCERVLNGVTLLIVFFNQFDDWMCDTWRFAGHSLLYLRFAKVSVAKTTQLPKIWPIMLFLG
jgi:hypothetical protein